MRFGNAVKNLFTGSANKAAAPKVPAQRFLELVTANENYTPPAAGTRALLELYNSNVWVRSIVGKISRTVAEQKWYFERENGERVDKHPALAWLNAGTRRLSGRQGRAVLAVHLDLAGEAFIAVGRDAGGKALGWAPVPPHWVTNIPETDEPKAVYEIQPKEGQIFRIPAAQMIHLRDPDPLDPFGRGSSNARPVRVDLDSDAFTASYLAAFFKNSARPDFIISGTKEKPMGELDRARAEEMWSGRFRGVAKAFRPFFSSQPLEIKELSKGLRDNDVSNIRGASKSVIAEFYGIPPEILGRLENSNRATIDAADLIYGKHVVGPRLAVFLDSLEPFIAENFAVEGMSLRYETPVQEDRAFQLTVMSARAGAFTDDEFRALAKHKPLGGVHGKPPEPADTNPDDPEDSAGGPPKGGKAPKEPTKAVDTPKTGSELSTVAKQTISPEEIVRISDAHTDPQVVAEATRLMDDIFVKLLADYGGELLGVLDAKTRFQINGRVAEWLANRGSRLISGIDETTKTALRASLVEGAATTEKVADLVDRIEKIFDDAASIRGPIIGTTEATAVTGFGSLEAARQGGFERKKWLSSGDQVVRSSHRSMDGQVKNLSEPFQSPSGAQADHPGDFGVASEDVNCRCAMRPVLDGEAEKSIAKGVSDTAFATAWDGMHARAALKIENTVRQVFAAQKRVVLAELNRLYGGAVYAQ